MSKGCVKVVIVGGGFAGLAVALGLSKDLDVTLVDQRPHFEFLPNIHELLSGRKAPGDLRLDLGWLMGRAGHRFLQGKAVDLDPLRRRVVLEGGWELPYHVGVLAIGLVDDTRGVRGVREHSMPFKSVDQCHAIGLRLRDLAGRGGPMRVAIVGGGLEGVEALGEILRRYRHHKGLEVHLVEAMGRLLPEAPPSLDREIRRLCRPYAVSFHTGLRVVAIEAGGVTLENDIQIPVDMTLWTGGGRLPELACRADLVPEGCCGVPVRPFLQSLAHGTLFVAGDMAQTPLPVDKQGYHAMDMGECVAANIHRLLEGKMLEPYTPSFRPWLISFGDINTFMITDRMVLAGPPLALAKEGVYQVVMAQLAPLASVKGVRGVAARLGRGVRGVRPREVLALPRVRRLAA